MFKNQKFKAGFVRIFSSLREQRDRTLQHYLLIHSKNMFSTQTPAGGSTTLTLCLFTQRPIYLLWGCRRLNSSRGSVWMDLMSHSRIICDSLFESESQGGWPLQTRRAFGRLVSNEAYFPRILGCRHNLQTRIPHCPDLKRR